MDDLKGLPEETGSKMGRNYQGGQQDKDRLPYTTIKVFQVEKEHGVFEKPEEPKMTEAGGGGEEEQWLKMRQKRQPEVSSWPDF